MSLGLGFSALGFAPFGTGDVDTAPAPASDNLIDEFGVQQSARAIDSTTGQYILNADGRFRGMPRVRQLVLLALRSMSTPTGDMGPQTLKRIQTDIEAALANLISRGLVAIVDVDAFAELPARARAGLKWRDLTTNQEFVEPI